MSSGRDFARFWNFKMENSFLQSRCKERSTDAFAGKGRSNSRQALSRPGSGSLEFLFRRDPIVPESNLIGTRNRPELKS